MSKTAFLVAALVLQTSYASAEQHYVVEPVTEKVVVNGSDTYESKLNSTQDVLLTAKRYLVTNESLTSVQYSCEDQDADGSKGNWNNFYSVPASQKADALAASIKGVGVKTAARLVPYFSEGKPRSWSAFSALIFKAEKELARKGVDSGWASQVVYRYKEDNIRDLGYLGDNCTSTVKVYSYNNRELVGEKTALVKVKVQNFSLLPGETETLAVTYNGKTVTAQSSRNYNIINNFVTYSDFGYRYDAAAVAFFTSVKRLQVNPSNEVQATRSTLNRSGRLTLVHPRYKDMLRNPEFRNRCHLVATVSLFGETGTFWNSKERALTAPQDVTLNLAAGYTVINLSTNGLTKNDDASVKYTLQYAPGCPFFTGRATLEAVIEE